MFSGKPGPETRDNYGLKPTASPWLLFLFMQLLFAKLVIILKLHLKLKSIWI